MDSHDESKSLLEPDVYNSYQNAPPVIHQLDDVLPPRHAWYGDASLRPNTGRTNSYDFALFGLALHELLDRLRLSIIVGSLLQCLITLLTWWQHLLNLFHLVLVLCVGAMALVLLVVEVSSVFRGEGGESAAILSNSQVRDDDNSNEAKVKRCLQATEKFGLMIVYHPIGKTLYLIVCGILCWIVGGIVEWILALLFWANAAVLSYCWATYPEFRQSFQSNSGNDDADAVESRTGAFDAGSMTWSVYSSHVSNVASKLRDATIR